MRAGACFFSSDARPCSTTAILLGQYFPLAGLLVPHAGLCVAIRGLVEQGDAANAQELVVFSSLSLSRLAFGGFDGAAGSPPRSGAGLEDLAWYFSEMVTSARFLGSVRTARGPHAHLLWNGRSRRRTALRESIILSIPGHHFGAGIWVDLERSAFAWKRVRHSGESTILPIARCRCRLSTWRRAALYWARADSARDSA